MATFRGNVRSNIIFGNDATSQIFFAIENKKESRKVITLRRLLVQMDALAAYTSVVGLIRIYRASNVTGGIIIDKASFDTTQSSDPNINFRVPLQEGSVISASTDAHMWQKFINAMSSAAEQQQAADRDILPNLCVKTGKDFNIYPGESIVVKLISPAAAANPFANNNYVVLCSWEENAVATFNISGTVTLGGSGVTGAIVTIIQADDESMTNPVLIEKIVTPAGGAWASTIQTGKVGAAFVQYKNGATYYTAPGSPFLS